MTLDVAILALPAATAVEATDVLPLVQSGTTKKGAALLLRGIQHLGYKSGSWYGPELTGTTGVAVTAARLYLYAYTLHRNATIAALAARVTTGAVTSNGKFALYANDEATGLPGLKVAETGDAATTGSNSNASAALLANYAAPRGIYWMAALFDSTPSIAVPATGAPINAFMRGQPAAERALGLGSGIFSGYFTAQAYASGFPSTLVGVSLTDSFAVPLAFQIA